MTANEVRHGRGILAYWFDLLPEVQPEWADWYIRDHMPSRLGTTFTGARCFRALSGTPGFMALYETVTPEALISPDYLTLLRNAPEGDRRRRAWYLGTTRGCCRVLADVGHGQGGVVGSMRFSPGRAPQEPGAVASELAVQLASTDRVGRVSVMQADPSIRARMDEARVTGHADGAADWALTVECAAAADVSSAVQRLEQLRAWQSLSAGATTLACYQLLYSIAR